MQKRVGRQHLYIHHMYFVLTTPSTKKKKKKLIHLTAKAIQNPISKPEGPESLRSPQVSNPLRRLYLSNRFYKSPSKATANVAVSILPKAPSTLQNIHQHAPSQA
jgi:hypothetical protein